jgi:calcineurin-like phosphoesterase family protein
MAKLIELSEGKAIIASDFHGNWEDFSYVKNIFLKEPDSFFIIAGDILDRGTHSEKILQNVIQLKREYGKRFHLLLGNHEWGYASGMGHHPCDFLYQMREKYGGIPKHYIDFLLSLPLAVRTDNGFIIIHAGPCSLVESVWEIASVNEPKIINGLVWNDPSPEDEWYSPNIRRAGSESYAKEEGLEIYGREALRSFLRKSNSSFLITGHGHLTALDIMPEQIMITSSFRKWGNKAWVELDLEKGYGKSELKKAVRYF